MGDVVWVTGDKGTEKYIVIGMDAGNAARLLLIGTVQKEESPLLGMTVVVNGFTRSVPASSLNRIGCAEIRIREDLLAPVRI